LPEGIGLLKGSEFEPTARLPFASIRAKGITKLKVHTKGCDNLADF
jgi:hypothetical protein